MVGPKTAIKKQPNLEEELKFLKAEAVPKRATRNAVPTKKENPAEKEALALAASLEREAKKIKRS